MDSDIAPGGQNATGGTRRRSLFATLFDASLYMSSTDRIRFTLTEGSKPIS
jgi:hypothetical protein